MTIITPDGVFLTAGDPPRYTAWSRRADPPGRDALPAGGDGAKQAPPGSAPNLNLHLSDDGEGAGPPSPNSAVTPATGASPAGGALCGGAAGTAASSKGPDRPGSVTRPVAAVAAGLTRSSTVSPHPVVAACGPALFTGQGEVEPAAGPAAVPALCGGPVEGRGHGAAGEPWTGLSNPHETPAPSADLRCPLRLLIAPAFEGHLTHKHERQSHGGMRWVTANDHAGQCSPDHRHSTPESALACFRGEGR